MYRPAVSTITQRGSETNNNVPDTHTRMVELIDWPISLHMYRRGMGIGRCCCDASNAATDTGLLTSTL